MECKTYKEVELYKALYGKSNIFAWWQQCVDDTPKGMWPLLAMKELRKDTLVAMSYKCWRALELQQAIPESAVKPRIILSFDWEGKHHILVIIPLKTLVTFKRIRTKRALNSCQ